jgi:hypothetical protein
MSRAPRQLRPGLHRWYDGWARYLALIGVVLTLGSTTIVFFTTGQDLGGLGDLVTACLGLMGLAVSLQLEILFRVSERIRTRDQYGRLLEMIEDYPDLLPPLANAAGASVATFKRTRISQFREEALRTLVGADIRLQELAQGRLRVADGDNTLTLARAAETRALLQGTTDEGDTGWWLGDSGTRFFELNAELIAKRNVQVERVWLLSENPDQETRDLLRRHHAIGVKVFLLGANGRDLDHSLLVNMTLMDGLFLHEDLPNKLGQAVEYLYSENAADLERARSCFAQLKARSHVYKGDSTFDSLLGTAAFRPITQAKL